MSKFKLRSVMFILCLLISIVSCKDPADVNNVNKLQGTWELISETKIERGDTTFTRSDSTQRMIKIINESHFAFLRHDLHQGKDSSAVFVAGGGSYTLDGNEYTERLEYCNFRGWENNSFQFDVVISEDTLTQQGTEKVEGLGIDRIIIEKYKRVKV